MLATRIRQTIKNPLFTDFREYAAGSAPSGWTILGTPTFAVEANVNAIGGKRLKQTGGDTILWDKVGAVDDVEILALFMTTNSWSGNRGSVQARVTDTANRYHLIMNGSNRLEIAKTFEGSFSYIAQPSFSWSADTWYWLRFRLIGTSLKAKAWVYGASEPSSWIADATDASLASGKIGFSTYNTADERYWDVCSVALKGHTAKMWAQQ